MAFVKSYSNYVIQKKHQLLNDGTVYERDFSTVGGVGDNFNSKHRLYRQGTFVYSINDERISPKIYTNENWEMNGESELWTQDTLNATVGQQNSLDILLKQDYYKLKEFAYYGSCVELIRSSIVDIVNRFPGEMTNLEGKYIKYVNNNGVYEDIKYEGKDVIVFDNPFNINIHTQPHQIASEDRENFKYLQTNINKYEIFASDNGNLIPYEISGVSTEILQSNQNESSKCLFGFIHKITFNTTADNKKFTVLVYYGSNNDFLYFSDKNDKFIIRPKQTYYDEFMKSLDSFQKLLLNKDSQPKYSAVFEVMEETEYGYHTFYEKFTFPLAYGDYNIDVQSSKYSEYLSSLLKYAEFFDELYCNNLYRQMTHESIKNFDWTDVLDRDNETREDYIENGDKIRKMLLICGRELDEIKFYIDGIRCCNNITYNDANNVPDYFLTDLLDIDGWDVKNIFPYTSSFTEDLTSEYQPYGKGSCGSRIDYPNGYFCGCWCDEQDCVQTKSSSDEVLSGEQKAQGVVLDKSGHLRNLIKQYINEKYYTMQELNNKFFKHLKLNSRNILRKKGTIEGIEAVLSLFGLKSKRWCDALIKEGRVANNVEYDYEIKEYVAITNPIIDEQHDNTPIDNLPSSDYLIDFLNSTKTVVYDTNEYINDIHVPYQGLPVRYYEMESGQRCLYPYFSTNIDGNPYYQMNGGWVYKNYYFEQTSSGMTVVDGDGGFIDTNTHIQTVHSLGELLKLNPDTLYDGIIYYVINIKGDYVCVNDEIYNIETMSVSNGETITSARYINVIVQNNAITIGNQIWYDYINTYDELGNIVRLDFDRYEDNSKIKIFIKDDNTIYLEDEDNTLINYSIFKDGHMLQSDGEDSNFINGTNYFKLYDKRWHNTLGMFGWNQLSTESGEYKTISRIKTNFKGNNPHTNGLMYDGGIEYLKYFEQLFKHAITHELFDSNKYASLREYMSSLSYMENEVGFRNLTVADECQERINLYEDSKVHNFCDYVSISSGTTNVKYFGELNDVDGQNAYYSLYDTDDYKFLNQTESFEYTYLNFQTCLDQIINLKNVDIIFKKYEDQSEIVNQVKYFDEVILHYLMQVIPSNVILNIKFE